MTNNSKKPAFRNTCYWVCLCLSLILTSGCSTLISHTKSGQEPDIHAKRSLGTALDDNAIVGRIEAKIRAINEQLAAMIQVDSYNRIVLLTGRVPDQGFIESAIKTAAKTPGVRQVHSEISKGQPTTISNYWYDAWLTTKVKSQLTMTSNAPASKTKVRSFAGYVYLMGVMTEQEAKNAIYVASRIPGAKKVISMIETVEPQVKAAIAQPRQSQQPKPINTQFNQDNFDDSQTDQAVTQAPFIDEPLEPSDQSVAPLFDAKQEIKPRFQQRAEPTSLQNQQNQEGFYNDYQTNESPQSQSVQGF